MTIRTINSRGRSRTRLAAFGGAVGPDYFLRGLPGPLNGLTAQ